jgi:hypothetical protein
MTSATNDKNAICNWPNAMVQMRTLQKTQRGRRYSVMVVGRRDGGQR